MFAYSSRASRRLPGSPCWQVRSRVEAVHSFRVAQNRTESLANVVETLPSSLYLDFCGFLLDSGRDFGDDTWQRWRSIGRSLAKIFTEKLRYRRGYLSLGNRARVRAFAQRLRIRAHDGDPDVLRTLLVNSVLFPLFEPVASAMIGGDDERCLIAVFRHRLHGFP